METRERASDGEQRGDWRTIERQLGELPDAQYLTALREHGVRAVLPSDKKQRPGASEAVSTALVRARWATGDWVERVDSSSLSHAQKFMVDPLRPPTGQGAVQRPPAIQPAPAEHVLSAKRTLGRDLLQRVRSPWSFGVLLLVAVVLILLHV